MTVITFLPPDELLSLNDRRHRMAHARLVKIWREHAWAHAIEQVPPPRIHGPSIVSLELPVRDGRARDPHNYVATLKPILDGITDAGVFVDDNSRWVATTEPTLTPRAELVVVTITPWRQELVA